MNNSRFSVIFGLIFIGAISRLLPHLPNCTSINAIAVFGFFYLNSRILSFLTVIAALFLSDLVLGLHSTLWFVYLSFGVNVLLGYQFNKEPSLLRLPLISVTASFISCVIVNFGVWLQGYLYEQTFNGLILCYTAAIPFFINRVLGDLVYCFLLGSCAYLIKKYKQPALAIK